MKVALLSVAFLLAIAVGGVGIYSADAASGHVAIDGYGVTSTR